MAYNYSLWKNDGKSRCPEHNALALGYSRAQRLACFFTGSECVSQRWDACSTNSPPQ